MSGEVIFAASLAFIAGVVNGLAVAAWMFLSPLKRKEGKRK